MTVENTGDKTGAEAGQGLVPRWIYPALLASLMINMLFVGLVAGRMWAHGGPHASHEHRRGGEGFGGFLQKLPEGRREILRVPLESTRFEVKAMRDEVRRLRKQARELMSRDAYDAAALSATMAQVNAVRAKLGERVAKGMSDLVGQMTADERKAFAAYEERRARHGRGEDR